MDDTTQPENPRSAIGGNNPPLPRMLAAEENFAERVTEWLEEDYRAIPITVTALLDEARAAPVEVTNDEELGVVARLIKRFRDEAAKIEAYRVKEAEPYLRGKQAVDGFMFVWQEKCLRRDRKAKPGAADVLQGRADAYQQRKLLAEQERRRVLAEQEAAVARAAQEKAAAEARAAEEARLAAERARKPETIEAKTAVADVAAASASAAQVDAGLATQAAEAARIETLAKPADIVRTRVDQGPTVTMATEAYALVEDEAKLDMAKLWPFITLDAKEKALRAWAKTTGHNQQMSGAAIGRRPKTVVR